MAKWNTNNNQVDQRKEQWEDEIAKRVDTAGGAETVMPVENGRRRPEDVLIDSHDIGGRTGQWEVAVWVRSTALSYIAEQRQENLEKSPQRGVLKFLSRPF